MTLSKKPEKSLRSRALDFLSRREYSKLELYYKLKPYAESEEILEALLEELSDRHWQSDERYAEQLQRSKGNRYGSRMLKHIMQEKGVERSLIESTLEEQDDLATAKALWLRRFKSLPQTPQEKAKQIRFLASRGFPMDVIRKVLSGIDLEELSDSDD